MEDKSHLELFQLAIRKTYPEISQTLPITIDPNVNEKYFDKRKISVFRLIEDKQAVDFKIRRFRHKFFISGAIEEISQNDVVNVININTPLRITYHRREALEIQPQLAQIEEEIASLNQEINLIRQNILEVKDIVNQIYRLSSNSEQNYRYDYTYPDMNQFPRMGHSNMGEEPFGDIQPMRV